MDRMNLTPENFFEPQVTSQFIVIDLGMCFTALDPNFNYGLVSWEGNRGHEAQKRLQLLANQHHNKIIVRVFHAIEPQYNVQQASDSFNEEYYRLVAALVIDNKIHKGKPEDIAWVETNNGDDPWWKTAPEQGVYKKLMVEGGARSTSIGDVFHIIRKGGSCLKAVDSMGFKEL